jgi:hypothetical protein
MKKKFMPKVNQARLNFVPLTKKLTFFLLLFFLFFSLNYLYHIYCPDYGVLLDSHLNWGQDSSCKVAIFLHYVTFPKNSNYRGPKFWEFFNLTSIFIICIENDSFVSKSVCHYSYYVLSYIGFNFYSSVLSLSDKLISHIKFK